MRQGGQKNYFWILAAVVVLASGCSTTALKPKFFAQAAPTDNALVYFYRPKRAFVGAGGWMEPRIGGESFGKLRNGEYIVRAVAPGTHSFQFRYSHPPAAPLIAALALPEAAASEGSRVELTLEAGRVYYVVYPGQKFVEAAKAMEDLKECEVVLTPAGPL